LLAYSSVEACHVDISVLGINTSRNVHCLVLFLSASEVWSSPDEELVPFRAESSASKVLSFH
jgi:hypothetical protein